MLITCKKMWWTYTRSCLGYISNVRSLTLKNLNGSKVRQFLKQLTFIFPENAISYNEMMLLLFYVQTSEYESSRCDILCFNYIAI